MLSDVIRSIESKLQNKWTVFRISLGDFGEIYSFKDIKYEITDNHIYVRINLPLTNSASVFQVYHVSNAPIQLTKDANSGISQITNVARYFGMNSDHTYYLELDHIEASHCYGNHIRRCRRPFAVTHTDISTCTLALFRDS